MFNWREERRRREVIATKLYEDLVAQARTPAFYLTYGVPDSMLGRFEMVCLHAYLLFRRLGRNDAAGRELAQAVHDLMFADFDRTLREQGIGDMGIGKRVKELARNLYGRIAAYETGLAGSADQMSAALRRNLYASVDATDAQVAQMIDYIEAAAALLDAEPAADLMAGQVRFPSPPARQEGQP